MDLGLKGKVAIVTGGSEGIGKAAAQSMAAEGARVAICARRLEVLEAAENGIRAATGGEVLAVQADMSKADGVKALFDKVVGAYGGVDILVNNAGTSAAGYFEEITDDAWQADLDLKLFGAIRCSRAAIPIMKARGGGPHHQRYQSGGEGSRCTLRADIRQPRGGGCFDEGDVQGLRPRQHPGQHGLHRPHQVRPARAPLGATA